MRRARVHVGRSRSRRARRRRHARRRAARRRRARPARGPRRRRRSAGAPRAPARRRAAAPPTTRRPRSPSPSACAVACSGGHYAKITPTMPTTRLHLHRLDRRRPRRARAGARRRAARARRDADVVDGLPSSPAPSRRTISPGVAGRRARRRRRCSFDARYLLGTRLAAARAVGAARRRPARARRAWQAYLAAHPADVVVSTYPLWSELLGPDAARRRAAHARP